MEQSPLIESNIRTIKNTLLIFLAIVGIMIIKALSGLLIPLAFAIFVGLMLQPVILYLDKKNWPYSVSITLITILTLGFLFLIGLIVFDTGAQIVDQKDKLLAQIDAKFIDIIDQLSFIPGVSSVETSGFIQTLNKLISVDFLLSTSGIVAGQLGTFTFNFILKIPLKFLRSKKK